MYIHFTFYKSLTHDIYYWNLLLLSCNYHFKYIKEHDFVKNIHRKHILTCSAKIYGSIHIWLIMAVYKDMIFTYRIMIKKLEYNHVYTGSICMLKYIKPEV